MAYELGTIWLQVIPSFDGVHDGAREGGRKAADEFVKGYDERERQLAGDREKKARTTGEKVGEAEAEGRAAGQRKAQQKIIDAEHDLERRLQVAEREYNRRRTAERRRHAEQMAEASSASDKKIEQAVRRHHERLVDLDREHSSNREKLHADHLNRIQQLEDKGIADAAAARQRAQKALDEAEERSLRASERRRRASLDRLRKAITGQAKDDPEAFERRAKEQLAKAMQKIPPVKIDADTTPAEKRLLELRAQIARLRDVQIGVDMDAREFAAEYAALTAMISSLDGRDIDLDVKTNAAKAHAELAGIAVAGRATQNSMRGVDSATRDAGGSAGSAANAFRAMNGVLLAAVTIGPALVPVLLSIAGALAAIATFSLAAIAGIGVGVLGLAGIGDAVGAMGDLENEQRFGEPRNTRQARRQTRGADRQVRSAQRGLDRARQAAIDAQARSLERQERAERNLARAQDDARRAQERLTRARIEARREIEDMNNALISGAMSERDALYDLEEARYALFRIMQDGSATQRERDRAQLQYDMQEQAYRELQQRNRRLNEDASGVSGPEDTQTMRSAREGVDQAQERVVDAQRELVDVARDREREQRDAADAIAEAELRLAEALENQRDVAADAAEGVGSLATAQRKLAEAMDALGPAGQAFAAFLFGLKPLLDELRLAAQEGFLPGLQAGLEMLVNTYGDRLVGFVGEFATALGEQAVRFGEWMTKPEVQEFFATFGEYMLIFLEQFGTIMPNIFDGLFGVITALLPFTEQFGEALIGLSGAFAEWAQSEEGQESLARFFEYLANISPEVWEMFVAMILAIANAIIAMAPYTEWLIENVLTPFLTWIAEMDPTTLRNVLLAIMAFTVAFQALAFVMSGLLTTIQLIGNLAFLRAIMSKGIGGALGIMTGGGGAAAGGTAAATGGRALATSIMRFGLWGLAIGGLLLLLYELYQHVEPFRNFVDGIASAVATFWNEYIYPVFRAIYDWIVDNLGPIFMWLVDQFKFGWDVIVSIFSIGWTLVEAVLKLFQVGLEILARVFGWLWYEKIKPVWDAVALGIRTVWDSEIQPILDTIGGWIREHVAPVWEAGIQAMGDAWNLLKAMVARPLRAVINFINEGLLDPLNSVLTFFRIDTIDHINVPASINEAADWEFDRSQYARGGILPGYSPGQDIHEFVSPTGGRLALSGGEAILRPEVARVLGKSGVDALNRAAISGGVQGVAQMLVPDGAIEMPDWLRRAGAAVGRGVSSAAAWVADAASYAWDFVSDPVGMLKDALRSVMSGISDFGDSGIGRVITEVPMNLVDMIGDGISSLLGGADATKAMSGPVPKTTTGGRIYGAQPHVDSAANLLAGWVGGIDLMQAFNRSMAGDHPQGLAVDFIDDFATLNRLAMMAAQNAALLGVRYIAWQNRMWRPGAGWGPQGRGYGNDPQHRWHVHISHFPRAREYADGGIFDASPFAQMGGAAPELRDGGGVIEPGLNYILNATGEKEWALTRQQLDNLRSSAPGGGLTIDVDIDRPGASADEIAEEILFAMRRHNRGGAYAGV